MPPSDARSSFPPPPSIGPRQLHAPWRLSYMEMLSMESRAGDAGSDKEKAGVNTGPKPASFLREYYLNPSRDEANHVIVRTGNPSTNHGGVILLNRYPYANGHLLVCLGESRARLMDYSEAQRTELWSLVDLAVDLCERTLHPQGVNIGVNQGVAAGAGVPDHLHMHVVPRWNGDVNFISVVGQVRVIPSALDEMARRYRDVWNAIKPG